MSNEKFFDAIKIAAEKQAEASFGDRSFPDAAFVVEKGTPKDPDGNGSLQAGRKLPHHNKNVKDPNENSSVDLPHLRNALARVNQVKTKYEDSAAFIKRATVHLQKHARDLLKTDKNKAEIESICAEFNIVIEDESDAAIKVMKNGTADMPYCVMQDGKKVECHATMQEAKDQMQKMMDKMNAGAGAKVVKNGSADKPFCVIGKSGFKFGCYPTEPEAQKRTDEVNNFGKK